MDRIAPSARLEAQIAELLTQGLADDSERLAEVGPAGRTPGLAARRGR